MKRKISLKKLCTCTCATILAVLLAVGSPVDVLSEQLAVAAETGQENANNETSVELNASDPQEQVSESEQSLGENALSNEPALTKGSTQDPSATAIPNTDVSLPEDSAKSVQINNEVPLGNEDTHATTGSLVFEGLVYTLQPDGQTVLLSGFTSSPEGDVVIPAALSSGEEAYEVTLIGSRALAGCSEITSLSLPASIANIGEGAFEGCAKLKSIEVSAESAAYTSYDGLLYDKMGQSLLHCPEGKTGTVRLPDSATEVAATAFIRCPNVRAFEVGEANTSLSSYDGLLYSKDRTELLACAPGAPESITLAPETRRIDDEFLGGGCIISLRSAFLEMLNI